MDHGKFNVGDIAVINYNPGPIPRLGKVLSIEERRYQNADKWRPDGAQPGDRYGDLVTLAVISVPLDGGEYKITRRKITYDEGHLLTLQEHWDRQNKLRAIEGRILADHPPRSDKAEQKP